MLGVKFQCTISILNWIKLPTKNHQISFKVSNVITGLYYIYFFVNLVLIVNYGSNFNSFFLWEFQLVFFLIFGDFWQSIFYFVENETTLLWEFGQYFWKIKLYWNSIFFTISTDFLHFGLLCHVQFSIFKGIPMATERNSIGIWIFHLKKRNWSTRIFLN